MAKIVNNIFAESCFKTIDRIIDAGGQVDIVLTSPPYNTGRHSTSERSRNNREGRYDIHIDNMTDDEYLSWTVDLFNNFDKILKPNGVILYNVSYSTDMQNMCETYNPHELMWRMVNDIITQTNFTTADCIIWKKSSALPNNTSSNKLTRIIEYIYVFVRKSEFKTFHSNKEIKSISKTGQKFYENVFNFIEAPNNDGSTKLNKATYSSLLCEKLLKIYAKPKSIVYDCFMGTGTTAVACKRLGHYYIGSEISQAQVDYANERINSVEGVV